MTVLRSDVAIVLGSGLNPVARELLGDNSVPYSELQDMPPVTVPGHEGSLYPGTVGDKRVLAFAGRAHLYEGHDPAAVTSWVRLAVKAGCSTLVITNAAGAISPDIPPGTAALISDHLNLTGANPLVALREDRTPFVDMGDAYDPELRALARSIDPSLPEGVYAGLLGPSYETHAEIRMLRTMGADLVGMSTVLETIMARYLGARVLGISLVTNPAAGLSDDPLEHEEIAATGRRVAPQLANLLRGVIEQL